MAAVADISLGQELYMKMQSESTISYLLGPRDAPAYSRPYSSSEATVRGVFGVLGEESRLSAKTTLVASEAVPVAAAVEHGKIRWRPTQRTTTNSAAACGGGIACLSGKMNRSSSTSSTKAVATGFGANAIDGSLSLSIRPAGWTLKLLGPSMRRLGAGTGGCVVAVKTLQARGSRGEEKSGGGVLSRRVLEELGIAVNVQHRNVIQTFEVIVEADRRCYVVMEACAVDLLTLIQRQAAQHGGASMSAGEINGYFGQLLQGVQYLHGIGVAHRDLKLDNVCVTEQGVLKIIDFGCATLFRRRIRRGQQVPFGYQYVETQSVGACGSDPYMAPELFVGGDGYYAARKVDVWALGIMYFGMRFVQFPWAVAHGERDQNYRAFEQSPRRFLDRWIPDARPLVGGSLADRAVVGLLLDPNPATRADIGEVVKGSIDVRV